MGVLTAQSKAMEKLISSEARNSSHRVFNYGVPGSPTPIDQSLWSHPMLAFYI